MANEAGTVQLICNGEIYNYRELRRVIEARGGRLRTRCDTETILGLYELFGPQCVERLEGMFAFVLWDSRSQRLFAGRDRLGIKPLYVLRHGTTVVLASEIKAFLPLAGWRAEPDEDLIPEYLGYRHLMGRRTLVRGVERVEPGETMMFGPAKEERRRYWDLPHPIREGGGSRTVSDWSRELEALLARSVREHLVSDVPVGTFNSGGVDSSLVTALAAREKPEAIHTYSVGFHERDLDESPYAELVSQTFSTRHHRLVLEDREYAESLPDAIWHHDEPLDHPHTVHLLHLSRLARERVTVVLTGEGSDELFGGYTRYRLPRLLDRFASFGSWPSLVFKLAATFRSERERLRVRMALEDAPAVRVAALTAFVWSRDLRRLLAGPLAERAEARTRAVASSGTALAEALWFDQQTYLQSLLNRMDKMSMAASLEGRVPFLDHRVVEFAARVPTSLKVRGLETKYLLKDVARRHLPESIVRRRKAGFSVPITSWFRPGGALNGYLELLLERRALERGYLDPAGVRRVLTEHRSGERDHAELLWGMLNLELWQRIFIEGKPRLESQTAEVAAGRRAAR